MMQRIYEARDIIEANLLKGLLEQEGIACYVDGAYLQGGIGELPVINVVGISVDEEDVAQAESLIKDYEADLFILKD